MAAIEIRTTGEGPRLEWVTIYTDSDPDRAVTWGNNLLMVVSPQPELRILDKPYGKVIGSWQGYGYEDYA